MPRAPASSSGSSGHEAKGAVDASMLSSSRKSWWEVAGPSLFCAFCTAQHALQASAKPLEAALEPPQEVHSESSGLSDALRQRCPLFFSPYLFLRPGHPSECPQERGARLISSHCIKRLDSSRLWAVVAMSWGTASHAPIGPGAKRGLKEQVEAS